MSNQNKKQIPQWALTGHKKPVTRREFLAHGIIPFAATTFLPNWLKLLAPNEALAQVGCPAPQGSLIPFVQLNLAGGAGLMANFVPMNAQGSTLASYDRMGLGNSGVPIEREFGNVPFAGMNNGSLISKVLEGIRAAATPEALARTAFVGVCVRSRDDSSENFFALNGMVHKAGLVGTKLPNLGSRDTVSGITQRPAMIVPPSPLVVRSYNDIANSLSYTAALGSLSQIQKEKLTKLVSDLNSSQARKLASISDGAELQKVIECAGIKNNELVQEGTSAVDPAANTDIAGIWNISRNTNRASESYVFSSMVYNTLLGNAGSSSLNKGGYDYHGNNRGNTNNADRNAGVIMGRILQTAHALQKPVYLVVTSDGAVGSAISDARDAQFTSDRGSAGLMYILAYHPSGRPQTSGFQIGQFTDGQAADDTFITGNNPELASQAVFANYLKFNNRMDLFNTVLTRNSLSTPDLLKVVKFG